jgi:hypothetical protein
LFSVQAVDLDAGENARLTFSVDNDHFNVESENANTAVIKVAK